MDGDVLELVVGGAFRGVSGIREPVVADLGWASNEAECRANQVVENGCDIVPASGNFLAWLNRSFRLARIDLSG